MTKYRIIKDANGLYDVQFRFCFIWLTLSLGRILRTMEEAEDFIVKDKTKDIVVYTD